MTNGRTGDEARVLVTGGTGFVGRHLVASLTAAGREVHLLVRSKEALSRLGPLARQVTAWTGDLTDAESLDRAVAGAKAGTVYHLAARTDLRRTRPDLSDVGDVLASDVAGSMNLIKALAAARRPPDRMIQTGSLAEYGIGPFPSAEDQREQPVSGYGAGLVMRTHLLQALQARLPFPAMTLRLALVYGPDQRRSFLVPALIEACLDRRPFTIKNGQAARDLIHVDDVVRALIACDGQDDLAGEIVNVGTGIEYPTASIGRQIARLTGAPDSLLCIGSEPQGGDQPHFVGTVDKARTRLGWQAGVALEDGLLRTIAWHREQRGESGLPAPEPLAARG